MRIVAVVDAVVVRITNYCESMPYTLQECDSFFVRQALSDTAITDDTSGTCNNTSESMSSPAMFDSKF